jgi:hypothetical protein
VPPEDGERGPPEDGERGPPEDGERGPPEDGERGPPGTAGPRESLPDSFAQFGRETAPGARATLDGLRPGMVQIEREYAAATSIELVRNDRTNFTLDIEVTGNATNVTFYVNVGAIEAAENIEGLEAYIDGEATAFGEVRNAQGGWIAFEVDHFSERRVTFETESAVSGPLPGVSGDSPNNLDGDAAHEDVNGDGRSDFEDVVALLFADADRINAEFTAEQMAAVDFDGDGRFGFGDVVALLFEGRAG